MRCQDQQQFRTINELCSLVFSVFRSPPFSISVMEARDHLQFENLSPWPRSQPQKPSASEIAALLLGVSLTLMLCGSVTFMIGFFLMPWVVGMLMVLYFIGMVMNFSGLGRSILVRSSDPVLITASPRPPKDMPSQYLSKLT